MHGLRYSDLNRTPHGWIGTSDCQRAASCLCCPFVGNPTGRGDVVCTGCIELTVQEVKLNRTRVFNEAADNVQRMCTKQLSNDYIDGRK